MPTQITQNSARTQGSRRNSVSVGDNAPDFELLNSVGASVKLSDEWQSKPVTLIFLRHFGCIFCREQVALIRREYQKLLAAGTHVVCIANGPYKVARAFEIYFDLPFPVLVSDDTSPFQAYGLEKANLINLLKPSEAIRAFVALFGGNVQGKVIGDPYQMPGAFIVDTSGIIRYVHRSRDASDNINVAEILDNLPKTAASVE